MGDVQAYQGSVGEDRASAAASLYAAGVDVGANLALYHEQHDAGSQAELAAADLMCQWAKSLTPT